MGVPPGGQVKILQQLSLLWDVLSKKSTGLISFSPRADLLGVDASFPAVDHYVVHFQVIQALSIKAKVQVHEAAIQRSFLQQGNFDLAEICIFCTHCLPMHRCGGYSDSVLRGRLTCSMAALIIW